MNTYEGMDTSANVTEVKCSVANETETEPNIWLEMKRLGYKIDKVRQRVSDLETRRRRENTDTHSHLKKILILTDAALLYAEDHVVSTSNKTENRDIYLYTLGRIAEICRGGLR